MDGLVVTKRKLKNIYVISITMIALTTNKSWDKMRRYVTIGTGISWVEHRLDHFYLQLNY